MYMWTLRPKIFFSWLSVIWLFFSNQPLRILRRWLSHKTFKLIKLYATTYNGVGFLYILKRNNFRSATFTLQKIKVHTILNAWMVPNYAMYSKINLRKKVINMSYAKSKMFWLQRVVQSWRAILLVGPKLYIPSTLNIDLMLWYAQLIVCAVKC